MVSVGSCLCPPFIRRKLGPTVGNFLREMCIRLKPSRTVCARAHPSGRAVKPATDAVTAVGGRDMTAALTRPLFAPL